MIHTPEFHCRKHQLSLTRQAIARLIAEESPDADVLDDTHDQQEEAVEEKISLNEQQLGTVLSVLNSGEAVAKCHVVGSPTQMGVFVREST